MATLRMILYGGDFTLLDSVDIAVTGKVPEGAGAATKAAKEHFWKNHVQGDLDTLLASRKATMDAAEALLMELESKAVGLDENKAFRRGILTQNLKATLMEAKLVDDLALPQKYRDELQKRFQQ